MNRRPVKSDTAWAGDRRTLWCKGYETVLLVCTSEEHFSVTSIRQARFSRLHDIDFLSYRGIFDVSPVKIFYESCKSGTPRARTHLQVYTFHGANRQEAALRKTGAQALPVPWDTQLVADLGGPN